jgi:hypothetical protein
MMYDELCITKVTIMYWKFTYTNQGMYAWGLPQYPDAENTARKPTMLQFK